MTFHNHDINAAYHKGGRAHNNRVYFCLFLDQLSAVIILVA